MVCRAGRGEQCWVGAGTAWGGRSWIRGHGEVPAVREVAHMTVREIEGGGGGSLNIPTGPDSGPEGCGSVLSSSWPGETGNAPDGNLRPGIPGHRAPLKLGAGALALWHLQAAARHWQLERPIVRVVHSHTARRQGADSESAGRQSIRNGTVPPARGTRRMVLQQAE